MSKRTKYCFSDDLQKAKLEALVLCLLYALVFLMWITPFLWYIKPIQDAGIIGVYLIVSIELVIYIFFDAGQREYSEIKKVKVGV